MNLFVCNATPRHFHLHFRLPEGSKMANPKKVFSVNITPGGQKNVAELGPSTSMDDADVAHVIKQMEVYGARTVSEASAQKGFSGIIYSTARAVDVDSIHQGLSETDQIAIDKALESRKTNAMAADSVIAEGARKSGGNIAPLEVEITEQAAAGDSPNEQKRKETIEVQRPGVAPRSERAPRKSKD
jgi:hypothetical protein